MLLIINLSTCLDFPEEQIKTIGKKKSVTLVDLSSQQKTNDILIENATENQLSKYVIFMKMKTQQNPKQLNTSTNLPLICLFKIPQNVFTKEKGKRWLFNEEEDTLRGSSRQTGYRRI
ncbi:MAG: hypothetical protein WC525_06715 [Candidatus Thermoplasmatota archaeon]